jgi:hypothetical protein
MEPALSWDICEGLDGGPIGSRVNCETRAPESENQWLDDVRADVVHRSGRSWCQNRGLMAPDFSGGWKAAHEGDPARRRRYDMTHDHGWVVAGAQDVTLERASQHHPFRQPSLTGHNESAVVRQNDDSRTFELKSRGARNVARVEEARVVF